MLVGMPAPQDLHRVTEPPPVVPVLPTVGSARVVAR